MVEPEANPQKGGLAVSRKSSLDLGGPDIGGVARRQEAGGNLARGVLDRAAKPANFLITDSMAIPLNMVKYQVLCLPPLPPYSSRICNLVAIYQSMGVCMRYLFSVFSFL